MCFLVCERASDVYYSVRACFVRGARVCSTCIELICWFGLWCVSTDPSRGGWKPLTPRWLIQAAFHQTHATCIPLLSAHLRRFDVAADQVLENVVYAKAHNSEEQMELLKQVDCVRVQCVRACARVCARVCVGPCVS